MKSAESLDYIKRWKELIKLGDRSFNANSRLIHLERMIKDDLQSYAREAFKSAVDMCASTIPAPPPEIHVHYIDELMHELVNRIKNIKNPY